MRIQTLTFTADYQVVAEAMKDMLKNPVVTEGEHVGNPMIIVEGDFEHFILDEMETWREHLKFEIQDYRIKDADDSEARAFLAQHIPGFGGVLFSPTIAHVYKRTEYKIVTSTVTERVDDEGRTVISRDVQESEPQVEWKEITGEFGRKVKPLH